MSENNKGATMQQQNQMQMQAQAIQTQINAIPDAIAMSIALG